MYKIFDKLLVFMDLVSLLTGSLETKNTDCIAANLLYFLVELKLRYICETGFGIPYISEKQQNELKVFTKYFHN